MKQFFKMFFASMLGMIVAGVIIIALLIGTIVGLATKSVSGNSDPAVVKDNSVLVIDLKDVFHEQGEENSFSFMGNNGAAEAGVYELGKSLDAAAKDNKVKGLYVKLGPSPNGLATLQQIRSAILRFRKSGKFVYAYGENITQGALYVASAADSIFVNPAGEVSFKGLSTSLAFFKNTLVKLEIEPEIFYAGKFKSATEPFRADKMSEPNRQQIAAMQKDVWNTFLQAIAEHNKSDVAVLHQLAQTAAVRFPNDALQHRLVDGVKYMDEVETIMKKKLGLEDKKSIEMLSLDDYSKNLPLENKSKDNRIAVIFAEGQIRDGESTEDYEITDKSLVETIRSVKNNDKIKAVVLRVNSPGGSARASEIILRELKLLREKKPIVVAMGDVAASGGYYISCAADSIFALPTTITGSIGVFSMLFNVEKLMNNKLGITFDTEKNAPYADFPQATRKLTEQEAAYMQEGVDSIYALFKRRVLTCRKNMDATFLDSIAQGRIWTGVAAKQNGLVDDLGDLDRAITSAAAIAKLKDYEVRTYPEKVDRLKSFLKVFKGSSSEEAISQALAKEIGAESKDIMRLKNLKEQNRKIMLLLPFDLSIQ